jgi:hypothetical protein
MNLKKYLFVGLMLLSSCSERFSESQLLGDYVAKYRGEMGTLSLKANHTYTHTVQLESGQVLEDGSTWKSSQVTSGLTRTVVEISGFRVIPSFGGTKREWATEVERTWFGRIQLCFDSDVGYCYVKQDVP